MQTVKLILVSALYFFPAAFAVWFLRNLFRPFMNQAQAFREKTTLIPLFAVSIVMVLLATNIYPFQNTPGYGLIIGLIVGWIMSR